jgi:calcium/calmodulin-dependent 3',5'-cyclic nucleotide phosphodiesterase
MQNLISALLIIVRSFSRKSFNHVLVCVSEQGSLTIVRRSSGKAPRHQASVSSPPPVPNTPPPFSAPDSPGIHEEAALEAVDLAADNLPPVDTPDACDKAALR